MSGTFSPQHAAVLAWQSVIVEKRSLTDELERVTAQVEERDRPLAGQLIHGVIRWHIRLEALLQQLVKKPLRSRDRDVQGLLLVGLFELAYLSTPDYAVVDRAVNTGRELGKTWASGLINGVLRNYLRRRDYLHKRLDGEAATRYAIPAWLLDQWREDWPDHWQQIAEASNQHPPMCLRVNRRRTTCEEYRKSLHDVGIETVPVLGEDALMLARPQPARTLPGFDDGLVSVQDAGAQLACSLLSPLPGQRVLDACAAPGGKTCHLGEREPELAKLVALDVDPVRVQRLQDNLQRCGIDAETHAVDAAMVGSWWDGQKFDRILLDAPCSATGVIRRHPDIRHLRQADDLSRMQERQDRLLDALWPTLAPDGILLYATCSVARTENESVVARFLQRCPDAEEDCLEEDWGWACSHGRQLLPGAVGTDGFYYARLRKARA